MVEFLKEAARVVPSKRQLDWFEMERYAFVHYGVNSEVCGPQGTHPHGEAPRRLLPVAEQIHGAQREKQPL